MKEIILKNDVYHPNTKEKIAKRGEKFYPLAVLNNAPLLSSGQGVLAILTDRLIYT